MSYMIRNKTLFVKVTRSSAIWSIPIESWEQIDLSQLPDDVCGTIEFKPFPAIGSGDEPEKKKDFKISVVVPKVASSDKEANCEFLKSMGDGKTINGIGFKLYEIQPSLSRKEITYKMEMETGKEYFAPKPTIDNMIALFNRLHSVKDCTTMEELKGRLLRATDNIDPIKNIHYFRIFFYILVLQGKVNIVPADDKSGKYRIVISKQPPLHQSL